VSAATAEARLEVAPIPMGGSPPRGRQVAVKGAWAQYLLPNGESYYFNVLTKEKTNRKPTEIVQGPVQNVVGKKTEEAGLFIPRLPEHWSERELAHLFGKYGNIKGVSVAREDDGRSKRYGWVNYDTQRSARAAIDAINGLRLPGMDMALEVRLAIQHRSLTFAQLTH